MKLQPLISWWLIIPYILAVGAFAGRQFWRIHRLRRKDASTVTHWIRRTALLALPALIAIGPSVQGGTSAPGVANLDILFVVDTTPSMGALDYAGTRQRLEGVRTDMSELAKSLQGAHMEIITFDSEASVILPLTTDSTAFATATENITPQINTYSRGSTIDKPINLAVEELKNAAAAYPEHYRIMFYLGDGEQTTEAKVKAFTPIARYLDGGAVMGYGTAKGARMLKYTGVASNDAKASYITTFNAATKRLEPAVSHVDTAALKKIATELKVSYQDRNKGGPISDVYQASKAALAIDKSQRVVHYLNLYWLVAIPYAGLIFWEWQSLIIKLFDLKDRRKARHA